MQRPCLLLTSKPFLNPCGLAECWHLCMIDWSEFFLPFFFCCRQTSITIGSVSRTRLWWLSFPGMLLMKTFCRTIVFILVWVQVGHLPSFTSIMCSKMGRENLKFYLNQTLGLDEKECTALIYEMSLLFVVSSWLLLKCRLLWHTKTKQKILIMWGFF